MRINKITIDNFRSLKHVEISPDNLNIFVGQNNHGKTNTFEAVAWFYKPNKSDDIEKIKFERKTENVISVEIEFTGAQEGANSMRHAGHKKSILDLLNGIDTVKVKRTSEEPTKRKVEINGKWLEKLPTGFDSALNDFLPQFEYIDTRKYFEDVAKFGKTTPVGVMLANVLTTILENNPESKYNELKNKFEEVFGSEKSDIRIELDKLSNKVEVYLEKQFPDCTSVKFEVITPEFYDLLKNFDTTINDGVETSAAEKGDGMQRALMLSILQTYSEFRKQNEDIGKSFAFFIDEAELHLHPSAQRKLKNVLIDLSLVDDQVFLNTHSSVLVTDENPGQKIFKVEKIAHTTEIVPTVEAEKMSILYDLLGGSPADLLLPSNFLIVEGRCELEFLTCLMKKYYFDKPKIQIVPANGDIKQANRSMSSVNKAYQVLGESIYKKKLVIFLDKYQGDQLRQFETFKSTNLDIDIGKQLFSSPAYSIEEYYPEPWHTVGALDGDEKLALSKSVGARISKSDFETKMKEMYDALKSCWENSFPQ